MDGIWRPASGATSGRITRECKEPKTLAFFQNALYEVTFNKRGKHSQSQLALLAKIPTKESIKNWEPVSVLLAPNGIKTLPENARTFDDYIKMKWKPATITTAPERVHVLGRAGMQGKRRQYGLQPRIAGTIHVGMGQNLSALVTRVHPNERPYQLWDRRQVIVLTSRTFYGKQTVFVGDPDTTANYLASLLVQCSQFDAYMEHLLNRLCSNNYSAPIPIIDLLRQYPYRMMDVVLPTGNEGAVYMLVSTRETDFTYIGETSNLKQRLDRHNDGSVKTTSAPYLRPWGYLGFVCGFPPDDSNSRKAFEAAWKHSIAHRLANSPTRTLTSDQKLKAGLDVANSPRWRSMKLKLVRTGKV